MKQIMNYLINIFILWSIFVWIFHSWNYIYLSNIWSDNFFKYESIEPVQEWYEIWTELKILSKMDLIVEWWDMFRNEILYCNILNDDYWTWFFSSYESSKINLKFDSYYQPNWDNKILQPWVYWGKTPHEDSECYIFAQQKYKIRYWITKYNEYTTGPFYFYK